MLSVVASLGQTPLQDVKFFKAYMSDDMVKQATTSNGLMNMDMLLFIGGEYNSLDEKIAIINALGANSNQDKNFDQFFKYTNNRIGAVNTQYWAAGLSVDEAIIAAYINAMSNVNETSYALILAEQAHSENINSGNPSATVEIVYNLIKSQTDKLEATRELNKWIKKVKDDEFGLKAEAADIIWNYMKQFYVPQASIWIISKSKNPYRITVNGKVLGKTDPYERYEYKCDPGYYHLEAKQVSGYTFYPTENRTDINVESAEDSFEFIIGVE